ncbi:hypothetical protein RPS27_23550, partial [Bradyrhizobium sp. WYCCWR 12699]|nr:hypothetical protein [Bradyrhizobium sp. WYCCWR 12699]
SGTQFTIWYTDGNGNYTSNAGLLAASSNALKSFETSFHQDLNGDGVIGASAAPPAGAIKVPGPSSLVQVDHPGSGDMDKHSFAAGNFSFIEASTFGLANSNAAETLPALVPLAPHQEPATFYETVAAAHETNVAQTTFDVRSAYYFDGHQADFILR